MGIVVSFLDCVFNCTGVYWEDPSPVVFPILSLRWCP